MAGNPIYGIMCKFAFATFCLLALRLGSLDGKFGVFALKVGKIRHKQ